MRANYLPPGSYPNFVELESELFDPAEAVSAAQRHSLTSLRDAITAAVNREALDEDEYELVRSETGVLELEPRPGAQGDAAVSTAGAVVRIDSASRKVNFETSVEYTVLARQQESRHGVVLRALSRSQKSFDRPSP